MNHIRLWALAYSLVITLHHLSTYNITLLQYGCLEALLTPLTPLTHLTRRPMHSVQVPVTLDERALPYPMVGIEQVKASESGLIRLGNDLNESN
jgi:hypothetical protein